MSLVSLRAYYNKNSIILISQQIKSQIFWRSVTQHRPLLEGTNKWISWITPSPNSAKEQSKGCLAKSISCHSSQSKFCEIFFVYFYVGGCKNVTLLAWKGRIRFVCMMIVWHVIRIRHESLDCGPSWKGGKGLFSIEGSRFFNIWKASAACLFGSLASLFGSLWYFLCLLDGY